MYSWSLLNTKKLQQENQDLPKYSGPECRNNLFFMVAGYLQYVVNLNCFNICITLIILKSSEDVLKGVTKCVVLIKFSVF